MKPALVILAAGLGRRYGGCKQIEPVGLHGELLIEYSIYDALQAGFGRVVFVIRRDIEDDFRAAIGDKIAGLCPVDYVFQSMDHLPEGLTPPPGRTKPWGTGHAVLCCLHTVTQPFCVITSDDFYGREAFCSMADYLRQQKSPPPLDCCLIGFRAGNTMTEYGSVSRACCEMDRNGNLSALRERLRLMKQDDMIYDMNTRELLPCDTLVSCGMMGFPPDILPLFQRQFRDFWATSQLDSAEFFLPTAVSDLVASGEAAVSVLPTESRWYGVTYREDRAALSAALSDMTRAGHYPAPLWKGFL